MIDHKLGYQDPTTVSLNEPLKREFTQGVTLGVLTGLAGSALLLAVGYALDLDHTRDLIDTLFPGL